ncbi:MAG: hypothetical protein CMJ70_17630 [Planctomycetaceae bacterium]|nr:hypothetical protein [Planctomycetaceae bacterium]|tara:strand:- start:13688 stop:13939 length:252 start_codon:yes stop_codon:yes gene_type:complete
MGHHRQMLQTAVSNLSATQAKILKCTQTWQLQYPMVGNRSALKMLMSANRLTAEAIANPVRNSSVVQIDFHDGAFGILLDVDS